MTNDREPSPAPSVGSLAASPWNLNSPTLVDRTIVRQSEADPPAGAHNRFRAFWRIGSWRASRNCFWQLAPHRRRHEKSVCWSLKKVIKEIRKNIYSTLPYLLRKVSSVEIQKTTFAWEKEPWYGERMELKLLCFILEMHRLRLIEILRGAYVQ